MDNLWAKQLRQPKSQNTPILELHINDLSPGRFHCVPASWSAAVCLDVLWKGQQQTRLKFKFKFGCRTLQQGVKSKLYVTPKDATMISIISSSIRKQRLNLAQSNSAGDYEQTGLLWIYWFDIAGITFQLDTENPWNWLDQMKLLLQFFSSQRGMVSCPSFVLRFVNALEVPINDKVN